MIDLSKEDRSTAAQLIATGGVDWSDEDCANAAGLLDQALDALDETREELEELEEKLRMAGRRFAEIEELVDTLRDNVAEVVAEATDPLAEGDEAAEGA